MKKYAVNKKALKESSRSADDYMRILCVFQAAWLADSIMVGRLKSFNHQKNIKNDKRTRLDYQKQGMAIQWNFGSDFAWSLGVVEIETTKPTASRWLR
ncbi:hypothetical protein [Paraburkholderia unamae]|uniref:hypothetical protein n=1 Tax=Paraburkholderia unamae TaxID=219649 RepID=UPI001057663E|nr:hypothetical protein [Paraburkholderia unamae]